MDSGWQKPSEMDQEFLKDVKSGLSAKKKSLSSKYFYDEKGDKLFQQIMDLKEYYLTDCEYEIFTCHKQDLLDHFTSPCDLFHLIEFGAGDAYKTKVLISHFLEKQASFEYNPIDISKNAVDSLVGDLRSEFAGLALDAINMEYFAAVEKLSRKDTCKKVVLFLGSNIGNFSMDEAQDFFSRLGSILQPGDQLLTGFDLRKNPETILEAYDDPSGITAAFNLNLLERINRQLGADFDTGSFYHYPLYDPISGQARSYLISRKAQEVNIEAIPLKVSFEESEPIFVEISQKYSLEEIHQFAERAGFQVAKDYLDERKYFVNSLWEIQ
jgi:dimethylhistidine N-methyltransferase